MLLLIIGELHYTKYAVHSDVFTIKHENELRLIVCVCVNPVVVQHKFRHAYTHTPKSNGSRY